MPRPARPLNPAAAERLCLVAATAFGEDGYEGASLNAILRSANMGKSSFYHRFETKAALHDWVTDRMAGRLRELVRPPVPASLTAATFEPELRAALDRMQGASRAHPQLMLLGRMFHDATRIPAEGSLARVRTGVLGWITSAVLTGRTLGAIRTDLPPELLTSWAIASLTAIDRWALGDGAHSDESRRIIADLALDALWSLLSPPR